MNVIASEWVKLRRPSMLLVVLALAAVATFGGIASVITAGRAAPARGGLIGGRSNGASVAELTSSTGLAHALAGGSTLVGVIVLGVTAALIAGEYSNGTLRNLLVREPRRARLLLGMLATIVIAAVVVVLVSAVIAVVGTIIAATSSGYDISAWGSTDGIWNVIGAAAQLAGAAIGWAIFGAVLAVGFRSSVLAIVVGIVWALPLEAIIGGLADGVDQWLPGKLLAAISAGGNDTATLDVAILTYAAYAVVALGATVYIFTRRDVSK